MKIDELKRIIEMSWSIESCHPGLQQLWNRSNPSLGQADITSLIVNDFIGGKIMQSIYGEVSHYFILVKGNIVDLTADQFNSKIPDYINCQERSREYILANGDTRERYLLLLNNVKSNFIIYGNYEYKLLDYNGEEYISMIPGTIAGNKKLKIYGKFDCKSALRYINRGQYVQNRVFFADEESAILAGYRPCGVCMKEKYIEWKKKVLTK
jgi:hypothetical protein